MEVAQKMNPGNYHSLRQSYLRTYLSTPKICRQDLGETSAPLCPLQHNSQEPRHRNKLNKQSRMNGLATRGACLQWNVTRDGKDELGDFMFYEVDKSQKASIA